MTLKFRQSLEGFGPSVIRSIFDAAPAGALNMGLGMPDVKIPATVIQAVEAELSTRRAPYSPNAGQRSLREAIAKMYGSWRQRDPSVAIGGWYSADGVIVTAGAQEALYVAMASLCEPGGEILVPDPGFAAYPMIARCIGAKVRHYPVSASNGFRPTASGIVSALTPKTRAVVLGSPANPTGVMIGAEEMESICLALGYHGVPYISDEIYDRYTWSGPFVSPSRFSDHGVVVSGLSKSGGLMGWRLGWLVVPAASAQIPTAVHQSLCSCASTLSQAGALAALEILNEEGPDGQWLNDALKVFEDRRARALSCVSSLGLRHAPADGAFYLFVEVSPRLRSGEDDMTFCRRLASEHGVVMIPGQGFGDEGRGWVRIAYTCDAIEEGFERLEQGLRG